MIKVTNEIIQAFGDAWERADREVGTTGAPGARRRAGLEAVLALVERDQLSQASDQVSDGYHTFGELYDHRRALTAVLAASAASAGDSWRSKAHHPEDSPMFDGGYFIVGIVLPTGTISYHYELSHWDDFAAVPELEHAPKWDGATPADAVTRCLELARIVAGY